MLPARSLRDQIDTRALLRLTRSLVRIPTENPPGDERRALIYLEPLLRGLGFRVRRALSPRGRWNLLAERGFGPALRRSRAERGPTTEMKSCAERGPTQSRVHARPRTFLFNGHIDVVPRGDERAWAHPPFAARVLRGRLYGRGTADMKGGVAAFLEAVAALLRAGIRSPHRVAIHLVSDEESLGVEGTGFLTRRGRVRADMAVVGEPTNLVPALAAKGTLRGTIHVQGRAAHAATPELGLNAIELAAHLVDRLAAHKFQVEHGILGRPSLTVTHIRGGLRHNVVPPSCEIGFDRRIIPGEKPAATRREIARILSEARLAHPRLRTRIDFGLFAPPSEIPPDAEVVQLADGAIRALEGRRPAHGGLQGTTDARFLIADAGIPTLILGPGDLAQAHAVDEYVRVEDLGRAAAIYAVMLARFLETP